MNELLTVSIVIRKQTIRNEVRSKKYKSLNYKTKEFLEKILIVKHIQVLQTDFPIKYHDLPEKKVREILKSK